MATWNPRANELFLEARALPTPDERREFLDRACAGDAALRGDVESLLEVNDRAGGFLECPIGGTDDATGLLPAAAPLGAGVGPYKLLQRIGEGGMGTVFMAEQTHPVNRRVALKIIKAGMDTRQVVARFEAERQALALMDHPNIARVLDAGTTPEGRPYFVMELVRGVPITKYCDEHRLTPRERLELFVSVCQAVQHAHQKGIIHRDIKPSNVLVAPYDGRPVVKVIDFGVAKATGARLTEKTLFTEFGAVVGTLEYMSPEQAELNNADIDTRSDVYSLGVLLYELLTGTTPLDRARLAGAAFTERLRLVREEEPPRPSTRLSSSRDTLPTISAQRQMQPAHLARLVRGELDWIVMRALEKSRARRYETANGLAADVQRYLADEPVQACPPSAGYRLRKFVRRNRTPVTVVAVVLAALLVGIAGTSWGLVRAEQRRADAEQARTEAEQARRAEVEQRGQAVANLYDSLVREARALRLARRPGYRVQAWQRLREASLLDTPKRDRNQLRREAAASLGDFVGLEPTVLKGLGNGEIMAVALHPREPLLAVGFTNGTISVRRLPDGTETGGWPAHPSTRVVALAFDPEGKALASAAADGTIVLWGANAAGGWDRERTLAGDPLPDLGRSNRKAMTVAFTPDGEQVVACSRGGSTVRFWRTGDGRPLPGLEVRGQLRGCMAVSHDGRLLVAGCVAEAESPVRVWNLATRQVVQDVLPPLGHTLAVAFSPDGQFLACGGEAGIATFDTSDFQRRLHSVGENTMAVAYSPDNRWLLCGGQSRATGLWDVASNREVASLAQPVNPEETVEWSWVYSIAPGLDGRTVVSASPKTIAVWDLGGADESRLLKRFAGGVPGVAFSPRGDLLACICKDRSVTLWDTATGQLVRSLDGCQGAPQAVAFSPDGRLLVTGELSGKERVRFWDVESGRGLTALDPKLGEVWSVAFSPDGRFFAASGNEGWVIWAVDRGAGGVGTAPLLREVTRRQPRGRVGCVCFTADSSLLAWVGSNHSVQVWDLATARERPIPVSRLRGFVRAVWLEPSAPELPERRKWLWFDTLGRNEVWDVATERLVGPVAWPRELEVLPDEQKLVWCVELSPDRTRWALGDADGRLVLWDLPKVRARLEEAGLGWEPDGR